MRVLKLKKLNALVEKMNFNLKVIVISEQGFANFQIRVGISSKSDLSSGFRTVNALTSKNLHLNSNTNLFRIGSKTSKCFR